MEKVLKSVKIAALVFVGLFLGGMVNMGIIMSNMIEPPNGVDVTTEAGLKAGMHLFEPKHFIMPFLAHALGTFVAASLMIRLLPTKKVFWAYFAAVMFFVGGFMEVLNLPSPLWFSLTDLIGAYFPMSFIAIKLFYKKEIA